MFATETIPKNKRIIDYAGEKISNRESLKREARYLDKGHIWCFKLTNRTVIDAGVGGNIARFINHSCKPNCYVEIKDGVIWIRAAKTITEGHRTQLQLQHGRRSDHQVPLPAGLPELSCERSGARPHACPLPPRFCLVARFDQGPLLRRAPRRARSGAPRSRLQRTRLHDAHHVAHAGAAGAGNRATSAGRVTLMGSSLGAALAVLGAARFGDAVERTVLLAPAVMFAKPGHSLLPPERIDEWRGAERCRSSTTPTAKSGCSTTRSTRTRCSTMRSRCRFSQPTLIFQGLRDTVVDPRTVEQFATHAHQRHAVPARRRPSARVRACLACGRRSRTSWGCSIDRAAARALLVALLVLSSSSDRVAARVASAARAAMRGTGRRAGRHRPPSASVCCATARYEVVIAAARGVRRAGAHRRSRTRESAGRRSKRWPLPFGPTRSRTAGATAPMGSTCATRRTAR